MKALRLLRISLTVRNLAAAEQFYADALGFACMGQAHAVDPAVVMLLGARAIRATLMRRGNQFLELAAFDPPGAEYPPGSHSNDEWFQHCALATADINAAYVRLNRYPHAAISGNGPQALPDGSVAFKFRDPEGHPLELIQLAKPDEVTKEGIDHSAIVVADADRSIAFYARVLNMGVQARQVNQGPAQDDMDALGGTQVDIVGLVPAYPAPHVELLGYRHPRGRAAARMRQADVAASRLVFAVDHLTNDLDPVVLQDGTRAALMDDPDGHALLLLEAPGSDPGPSSTSPALRAQVVSDPGVALRNRSGSVLPACDGRAVRLNVLDCAFDRSNDIRWLT